MTIQPPRKVERLFERRRLVLALAGSGALGALGALAACGGGSVADTPPDETLNQPLGVGAGGTGLRWDSVITGRVAQLRPVAVGGVALTTLGATLSDGDGQRLDDNDIEIGMTTRVLAGPISTVAGLSTAQVQTLVVDTQVRGPAQRLDARTLLLLNQRVTLSASTVYGPGVDLLAAKLQLRIWGQLDLAGGRIAATRVARMNPDESPMLRGLLASVDPGTGQVQIGTLLARPGDAAVVPAALTAGAVVRAVLGERGSDGVWALLALREDALRPPDNVTAQLQGRVTQFTDSKAFALDGVPVDAAVASVEGAAYLALGAAVEVSGSMRRGVLLAREVHAEAPEPVEFEGRITACDGALQLMTVGGLQLHWSASTVFTRGAPRDLRVGRVVAGVGAWGAGQARVDVMRLQIEA